MAEEHVSHLIDAYALGALEPDEVDTVERHLATCAECRAEAERAKTVVAHLLYIAPPATPSPDLRVRTLARIRALANADANDSQRQHDAAVGADADDPANDDAAQASVAVHPLTRTLRSLIASLPGGETVEPVEATLRTLLSEPDCVIWPLNGTDDGPGASARLVGSRRRRRAVLLTSGLRRLTPNQAYQVWFLHGGKPQPNALFSVDRAGRGASIVRASAPLAGFETVAVTPEPAGGSPGPTGPIVLVGALSQ
ncbi:MAG: anti-sigma factor [Ktedonobacterales bacterium]